MRFLFGLSWGFCLFVCFLSSVNIQDALEEAGDYFFSSLMVL